MPITKTDTTAPATDGAGVSSFAVGRFGRVPARWVEDPDIGVDELAVLTALAIHADRDGVCVVRQRVLAGLLQRSREWVCRVLARLCETGGFVEKEHRANCDGWNLACRYRLPDLAALEDGRASIPGEPRSGSSGGGADSDPVVECDPLPPEPGMPQPVGPVTPAPAEPVTPAPAAAVLAPAPAGVTEDAHQEQTFLNKESSASTTATLRCAGCHSREPAAADTGGSRPVPADWRPDAGDLAWLAEHRPDLDAGYMTAVFVCGSRARGLRYADPSAAWRRWALAERQHGRRPVASAEPPRRFDDAPQPMPSTKSEHHAAQEARNGATGEAVLARIMARRGEFSGVWMGG